MASTSRILGWLACTSMCAGCAREEPPTRPVEFPIVANESTFEAADSAPSGAVTFEFDHRGAAPHEVAVLRVPSGHSAEEAISAVSAGEGLPDWLEPVGGLEFTSDPSSAPAFTALLEPGEYVLACDPAIATGDPRCRRGMIHPLTVYPVDDPAPAPFAMDTIALYEYAYTLPDTIRAGRVRLRVENRGAETHDAEIMRVLPGMELTEIMAALDDPGSPKLAALGGFTGVAPGRAGWMEVTLEEGPHVLVCLTVSEARKEAHHHLGMVRVFQVLPRESWRSGGGCVRAPPGGGTELRTAGVAWFVDDLRSRRECAGLTGETYLYEFFVVIRSEAPRVSEVGCGRSPKSGAGCVATRGRCARSRSS